MATISYSHELYNLQSTQHPSCLSLREHSLRYSFPWQVWFGADQSIYLSQGLNPIGPDCSNAFIDYVTT